MWVLLIWISMKHTFTCSFDVGCISFFFSYIYIYILPPPLFSFRSLIMPKGKNALGHPVLFLRTVCPPVHHYRTSTLSHCGIRIAPSYWMAQVTQLITSMNILLHNLFLNEKVMNSSEHTPFVSHRQLSMFPKAHSQLPAGDWKWLVRKGRHVKMISVRNSLKCT